MRRASGRSNPRTTGIVAEIGRPAADSVHAIRTFAARIGIEEQISERVSSPVELWCERGLPGDTVDWILDTLRRRMNWPNANFHPDDPIRLLLTQEFDEFASYDFFLDLRDRFKIKVTKEETENLCREGQTIEGLVARYGARRIWVNYDDRPTG